MPVSVCRGERRLRSTYQKTKKLSTFLRQRRYTPFNGGAGLSSTTEGAERGGAQLEVAAED